MGFSSLSKANINNNKGDFYVAFFQLSIGLERLMKLTLILDYMATNELNFLITNGLKAFLTILSNYFKVLKLLKNVLLKEILSVAFYNKGRSKRCLIFLDDFAQKARYANLDTLTGKQNTGDPLERWSKLAKRIFASDIHHELKQN